MPGRYAAPAALLLTLGLGLGLAACSDGGEPGATPSPTETAEPGPSAPASDSATPAQSPAESPAGTLPPGGTAAEPTVLEAGREPLDWQPVEGPTTEAVTTNGTWTLRVAEDAGDWELQGAGSGRGTASGERGWRVSDALLDDDWAVVVLQDENEEQPSRAIVTDLESGKRFTLDGRGDVPTVNGGTWALHDGILLHGTYRDGAYCLAETDLEDRASRVLWCSPPRHGFTRAQATDGGVAMLTFDDSRISCRTLVRLADGEPTPFPGIPDCKGWDALLLDSVDGAEVAVWSVVPKERRQEEGRFYARVGEGYYDLGPGTTGTLTECGEAAYFVRDPQRSGDPAALMRWSPEAGLSVVYESPGGEAFLEAPRCGGDVLTVGALAEEGDEQVVADLDLAGD